MEVIVASYEVLLRLIVPLEGSLFVSPGAYGDIYSKAFRV